MTGTQKVENPEAEIMQMYLGGVDASSLPSVSLLRDKIDEVMLDEGFVGCIYNLTVGTRYSLVLVD